MNTFLPFWMQLVETFGLAGAAMVLIYGGLVAALLVSMFLAGLDFVRRRRREARLLEQDRQRRRLDAIVRRHVA